MANYIRNGIAGIVALAASAMPVYAASKDDVEKAIKIMQKSGTPATDTGDKCISMNLDSGLELMYFPGKRLQISNMKRFLDGKVKCIYMGYDKDFDGKLDMKGSRGKMKDVQGLYDEAISQTLLRSGEK